MRCDSGFWSEKVIGFCEQAGSEYSITVKQTGPIRRPIDAITPDGDGCPWLPMLDYPDSGVCEIAECDYDDTNPDRRLIVRRVAVLGTDQQVLFPDWDHHAFVTNRAGALLEEDAIIEPTPSANSRSAT